MKFANTKLSSSSRPIVEFRQELATGRAICLLVSRRGKAGGRAVRPSSSDEKQASREMFLLLSRVIFAE